MGHRFVLQRSVLVESPSQAARANWQILEKFWIPDPHETEQGPEGSHSPQNGSEEEKKKI